ncbi:MAG TPA: winged helix-turn-helix transcriptional regulator [Ktedonobacteraceae bacterium]|nr:winged helix-turn-helix transcriptional regulator [Ktedonobacteraceae bacterium]
MNNEVATEDGGMPDGCDTWDSWGKWKPLIVWHLLSGTKRFGELRRLIPGATQQMLTMQLRELEQAGILHRQVYAQVPQR